MNFLSEKNNFCSSIVVLCFVMVLSGCLLRSENESAGDSDIKSGKRLSGTLVNTMGKPLAGARVKALVANKEVPSEALVKSAVLNPPVFAESSLTDAAGRFSFATLPPGDYNLLGDYQQGALVSFNQSVSYWDTTVAQDLGLDTLRVPGRLRGKIGLLGKGKGGVACYIPGTSYIAISDDSGFFEISRIPQGHYSLRYSHSGYRNLTDTGIEIRSGRVTRLAPRNLQVGTAGNSPPPEALTATYDTSLALVHLQWRAVPSDEVRGYLVYRSEAFDRTPELITSRIVTDTTFIDSLLDQTLGTTAKTCYYRIKSIDTLSNIGLSFSNVVAVEAAHPSEVATSISFDFPTGNEYGVSINDSMVILATYANPNRKIRTILWLTKFENEGWDTLSRHSTSFKYGTDTLKASFSKPGQHEIRLIALDEAGVSVMATYPIWVNNYSPLVTLGADTTVSLGDTIWVHGKATDILGSIVRLAWKIGPSDFQFTTNTDTTLIAPLTSDSAFPVVLKAWDEDGNTSEDTLQINVITDIPQAVITGPRQAFVGDTLFLSSVGSHDAFGKIVQWEWDVGVTGRYSVTTDSNHLVSIPAPELGDLNCRLRVTDDDGQTGTTDLRIQIKPRNDWIQSQSLAPFRDLISVESQGVFDGQFWLLGTAEIEDPTFYVKEGYKIHFKRYSTQIWHTADMVHWSSITPEFSPLISFNGCSNIQVEGEMMTVVCPSNSGGDPIVVASRNGQKWEIEANSPPKANAPLGLEPTLDFQEPPFYQLDRVLYFKDRFWSFVNEQTTGNVSEVWSKTKDQPWTRVTQKPAYGQRILPSVTVHGDKMWLYGGGNNKQKDDLWQSTDGVEWTRVRDSVLQPGRDKVNLLSFKNRLWLIGGITNSTNKQQVLSSEDGLTWTHQADATGLSASVANTFVELKGQLWQISAAFHGTNQDGLESDTWGEVWRAPY